MTMPQVYIIRNVARLLMIPGLGRSLTVDAADSDECNGDWTAENTNHNFIAYDLIVLCPNCGYQKGVDDDWQLALALQKTERMPTTTVAIVPPKIIVLRQWSDGNSFSSIRYILPQTTEWVGYTPTILINNKRSMSASARRVYILTFVTYALVHGTRTCWSYIKTYSQNEPLNFSTQFLGELDMTVLICLSISLKTLGWIG